MDVSKNRGGPPEWMVKIMENPMNKWMICGYHYFWKHPYGYVYSCCEIHVVDDFFLAHVGWFGNFGCKQMTWNTSDFGRWHVK